MNTKRSVEKATELQNQLQEIENKMSSYNKILSNKIVHLVSIAHSVSRKLNIDYQTQEKIFTKDLSFLNTYYMKLSFKGISFSEEYEKSLEFEYLIGFNNKLKSLKIPLKYLQMSDRDFAKVIRQKIKEYNYTMKEEERKKASSTFKKNQKMIEELQKENEKLQKVQESILHEQNKRAEKIEQKLIQKIKQKKADLK